MANLISGPMSEGVLSVANQVRSLLGMSPVEPTPEQRASMHGMGAKLTPNLGLGGAGDIQKTVEDKVTGEWHKPQTLPGKFAQTVGEFTGPGLMPSAAVRGAPTAATKAMGYASDLAGGTVIPALASETAGQLTEGTKLEPIARIAGALGGNLGYAGAKAYNAPDMAVRRATRGVTPEQWDAASAAQRGNTTGVQAAGPEYISQATDGASAVTDLMRVIEGSLDGRARTGPFFAQRPGQVDRAVGNTLDTIAPQSPTPSVLGPRAAAAAGDVVDGVRQDINATTRPLYAAAEPQQLDPAAFATVSANPRFQAALARLRGNPEVGPEFAGMADDSVAVVDAVTKDMLARGEAMGNKANPLYGPQQGALNTDAGVGARNAARTSVPEYDQALTQQAQLRRDVLEPIEQGPVGRVAGAKDTVAAGEALIPRNPMVGSGPETADAVQRLLAQDPETTLGLIRQNLGDRYARASTETQNANREFGGAKFHKDVAGNAPRQEVLDAVVGQVPNPAAQPSVDDLLSILQTTGRRKPIGSQTEFNRQIAGDLAEPGAVGTGLGLAVGGGGAVSRVVAVRDALRRNALRGNTEALAEMFIDPNSVELMRNAANRGFKMNTGEALARTGFQVAPMYGR
jgi:hypothetical protein